MTDERGARTTVLEWQTDPSIPASKVVSRSRHQSSAWPDYSFQGNSGGESLAHNADVCKIKSWLTPLCSILLILYTHFSAISATLPCCCLVSTFPPPQHLPSSLISSSPKHRLELLELFTPFPLFSLLQLLLSSPGYFPYLCVINIKKQERLPLPPAPHCESLQPASDSASLAVTSRQMWNYKGWGDGSSSCVTEFTFDSLTVTPLLVKVR